MTEVTEHHSADILGLHMETKKKIAGLLKTFGPQSQMAGVTVHWDGAEQSWQTGQRVKKGDAVSKGPEMQIALWSVSRRGWGVKHTEKPWPWDCVQDVTLAPSTSNPSASQPVYGSWLQKTDSTLFFVFHLQTFLMLHAPLFAVLLVSSNEQRRKPWWPSTICGRNEGADLSECDSCTKEAVFSQSEGGSLNPMKQMPLPQGPSLQPLPHIPKVRENPNPQVYSSPFKKYTLATRRCHHPGAWNSGAWIYPLSSAGPGIFTNSCNWWIHNSPCSFSSEAVCRVWLPTLLHWLFSFPMAMPTDGHWGTMLSRIYPRVWRNHHAKPTHERWEEDLVLELISMLLKVSFSSGDIKSNKEPPSENWEEPEAWLKD